MELSMEENRDLHIKVVTGVVKIIKMIDERIRQGDRRQITMPEIYLAGIVTDNALADGFIAEFMLKGCRHMPVEMREEVMTGRYDTVWRMINSHLKEFGHETISPVEIHI